MEQLPVTGTRKAKVLYDYDAHDASELSLLADEVWLQTWAQNQEETHESFLPNRTTLKPLIRLCQMLSEDRWTLCSALNASHQAL